MAYYTPTADTPIESATKGFKLGAAAGKMAREAKGRKAVAEMKEYIATGNMPSGRDWTDVYTRAIKGSDDPAETIKMLDDMSRDAAQKSALLGKMALNNGDSETAAFYAKHAGAMLPNFIQLQTDVATRRDGTKMPMAAPVDDQTGEPLAPGLVVNDKFFDHLLDLTSREDVVKLSDARRLALQRANYQEKNLDIQRDRVNVARQQVGVQQQRAGMDWGKHLESVRQFEATNEYRYDQLGQQLFIEQMKAKKGEDATLSVKESADIFEKMRKRGPKTTKETESTTYEGTEGETTSKSKTTAISPQHLKLVDAAESYYNKARKAGHDITPADAWAAVVAAANKRATQGGSGGF
jgi:hypothetical protein